MAIERACAVCGGSMVGLPAWALYCDDDCARRRGEVVPPPPAAPAPAVKRTPATRLVRGLEGGAFGVAAPSSAPCPNCGKRVPPGNGPRPKIYCDPKCHGKRAWLDAQEDDVAKKTKGKELPAAGAVGTLELPPQVEVVTLGRVDVAPAFLADNPLNPRSIYDPVKIAEGASSMRRVGWFGEATARFKPEYRDEAIAALGALEDGESEHDLEELRAKWIVGRVALGQVELVCGHKRKRSAVMAGLATMRVEVRDLTDQQALDMMMAENMDRGDLHPLEEADGFRRMVAQRTRALDADEVPPSEAEIIDEIAARVGRPASFVRHRLRFVHLEEDPRREFLAGRLTSAHALQIAALQPQDQINATQAVIEDELSSRGLGAWVREEVLHELDRAPWSREDEELVPSAGSCKACPKRTGAELDLFAVFPEVDSEKDRCTDGTCFDAKREAFIARAKQQAEVKAGEAVLEVSSRHQKGWNEEAPKGLIFSSAYSRVGKKDECDSAKAAVVVDAPPGSDRDGMKLGMHIRVCADPRCKVHFGGVARGRAGSGELSPAEKKARAEQKRQVEATKKRNEERRALTRRVVTYIGLEGWQIEDSKAVARMFWKALWANVKSEIGRARGWCGDKKTADQSYHDLDKPFNAFTLKANAYELEALLIEMAIAQGGANGDGMPVAQDFAKRCMLLEPEASPKGATTKPAKKKAAKAGKKNR